MLEYQGGKAGSDIAAWLMARADGLRSRVSKASPIAVRRGPKAPGTARAAVTVALTVPVVLHTRRPLRRLLPWTLTALSLYAAAFILTLTVNVPLNERLADMADLAAARSMYEGPWVTWNIIRTALSILALLCLITAVSRLGHLSEGVRVADVDEVGGRGGPG
ncbi:hypothetical protein Aglo03_12250 [Actinokineospora globicatena]|uniref:DUF1772 domain-containing protein n=1 Tax=Actinokineospora globicatena TaxID=103729 RepID=A0A9W6V7Y3_9PSEU|nr:hypothetical protein Aglo03_12250 [Actinokineospora globicatena]